VSRATAKNHENARITAIVVDSRKQSWPSHGITRAHLCLLYVR